MEPAPPHENPHITFIIPIRHQLNAKNWSELRANLTQTVKSIANQDFDGWRAIIVANHGADLPPLPPGFTVERVDFPPNRLHEQGNADKQSFYDAFRIDKGRRVLAGMLRAKPSDYFMIVDDDDFVSNRLSRFECAYYIFAPRLCEFVRNVPHRSRRFVRVARQARTLLRRQHQEYARKPRVHREIPQGTGRPSRAAAISWRCLPDRSRRRP